MESMYTAAALEPLSEKTVTCDKCNGEGCDHCNGTGKHVVKEEDEVCPKCGKVHTINADCGGAHEAIDDPDDQYNTEYQVDPELDAAADGSLVGWINKQTEANPAFVQKFIQFIQDTEGINPDDTGRIPPSSKWQDDPTRNPNAPKTIRMLGRHPRSTVARGPKGSNVNP